MTIYSIVRYIHHLGFMYLTHDMLTGEDCVVSDLKLFIEVVSLFERRIHHLWDLYP